MPISTGRKGKPPSSWWTPMVKRCTPMIGSGPTMVMTSPMAPDSRPLVTRASDQARHHRQRKHEQREEFPGAEFERQRSERPGEFDQAQPAERAADEGRPGADPDRAAGLALFGHREAVEGGGDRRRRAGDADQAGGDRAAGGAADIDADHGGQALQRIEPEGEGQHHDHRHGDGDAGQRPADHAGNGADQQRDQVLQVQHHADVLGREVRNGSHSAPGSARQQHRQVVLKDDSGRPGWSPTATATRAASAWCCAANPARSAAPSRTGRSRCESRAGQQGDVEAESMKVDQHQPVVRRARRAPRRRPAGAGRRACAKIDHDQDGAQRAQSATARCADRTPARS